MNELTHTKIVHTHPRAGVKTRLLGRFVSIVAMPEFVGEPKVAPGNPTLSHGCAQLFLTAVPLCGVNMPHAALFERM